MTINQSARCARNQRKRGRVANGLHRQVDVQHRPVKMVRARPLNLGYLFDRPLSEPGELIKGYEQFLVGKQKPKTVLRNMGDFSRQSGGSRHFGYPSGVHSQWFALAEVASRKDQYGWPEPPVVSARTSLHRLRVKHEHECVSLPAKKRRDEMGHHEQW